MERTNTKKFTANTRNRRYKGYGAGYTGLEHSPLGRGYNVNDYDLNDPLVVDGEEWIVVLQHGMRVFERLNPNRERVPFVPIVPEATPAKKKTKTPKPATASKPEPKIIEEPITAKPEPEIVEEPIVAKPETKPKVTAKEPIEAKTQEIVDAPITATAKPKPKPKVTAKIVEEPIEVKTQETAKPETAKPEPTKPEPTKPKKKKAVDPHTPPTTAEIVNDAIDVADVETTKKAVEKAKTIVIAPSPPDIATVAKEATEAATDKPKRASRAKIVEKPIEAKTLGIVDEPAKPEPAKPKKKKADADIANDAIAKEATEAVKAVKAATDKPKRASRAKKPEA